VKGPAVVTTRLGCFALAIIGTLATLHGAFGDS
jgi:hypothetical protein